MKYFTDADVQDHNCVAGAGKINTDNYLQDLVYCPLDWQRLGLQETANGYSGKRTTGYKINFNGKLYRIYATCYSNAASNWFIARGRKIFIN